MVLDGDFQRALETGLWGVQPEDKMEIDILKYSLQMLHTGKVMDTLGGVLHRVLQGKAMEVVLQMRV